MVSLSISSALSTSSLLQIGKGQNSLLLQLLVSDNDGTDTVLTVKSDLLICPRIQFVQAYQNMPQIQLWSTSLGIDCVEYIVSEQLQNISLAILAPFHISFVLWSLIDEIKLGQQSDQTAIFKLSIQVSTKSIFSVENHVVGCDEVTRDASQEVVNVLASWYVGRGQKPRNRATEVGSISTQKTIDGNLCGNVDMRIVRCEREHEPSKEEKIFLLQLLYGTICLELNHIQNSARTEANTILLC